MKRLRGRQRDLLLLATPVVVVLVLVVGAVLVDGGEAQDPSAAAPPGPADAMPEIDMTFTDVADEAGVWYLQHERQSPPNCLFDGADDRPLPEGAWSQAMSYVDCYEERFTGGVAVGDYDGDALDDLYVTQLDGTGVLFQNLGDGTFGDRTANAGLDTFEGRGIEEILEARYQRFRNLGSYAERAETASGSV